MSAQFAMKTAGAPVKNEYKKQQDCRFYQRRHQAKRAMKEAAEMLELARERGDEEGAAQASLILASKGNLQGADARSAAGSPTDRVTNSGRSDFSQVACSAGKKAAEPTCAHNSWDNVRVTKGQVTLRCRVCQVQWRTSVDGAWRKRKCALFGTPEGCNQGSVCPKLHLHPKKQSLWERVDQHGCDVLFLVPVDAITPISPAEMHQAGDSRFAPASGPDGMNSISSCYFPNDSTGSSEADEHSAQDFRNVSPVLPLKGSTPLALQLPLSRFGSTTSGQCSGYDNSGSMSGRGHASRTNSYGSAEASGVSYSSARMIGGRQQMLTAEAKGLAGKNSAKVGYVKPCTHNRWENVRVKKGLVTLRCRECQQQWRQVSGTLNKCPDFPRCPNGAACEMLHVHSSKKAADMSQNAPLVIPKGTPTSLNSSDACISDSLSARAGSDPFSAGAMTLLQEAVSSDVESLHSDSSVYQHQPYAVVVDVPAQREFVEVVQEKEVAFQAPRECVEVVQEEEAAFQALLEVEQDDEFLAQTLSCVEPILRAVQRKPSNLHSHAVRPFTPPMRESTTHSLYRPLPGRARCHSSPPAMRY
ncbi:hypothetical protein DIPPA_02416 [Diplonema papillatum]|nr:hypothetical protein DIPPA_02416 [Diplonema papillatum]|eukprot:gene20713-31919_t